MMVCEPVATVPTLKGEEKTKPAARRQTHTQGRFLVILTVWHIFLPLCQVRQKKTPKTPAMMVGLSDRFLAFDCDQSVV